MDGESKSGDGEERYPDAKRRFMRKRLSEDVRLLVYMSLRWEQV